MNGLTLDATFDLGVMLLAVTVIVVVLSIVITTNKGR